MEFIEIMILALLPDGFDHGVDNGDPQARMALIEKHVESQIERIFAVAFSDRSRVEIFAPDNVPKNPCRRVVCFIPQLKVGRYRLDFGVLFFDHGKRLHKWAVECDGRDWHTMPDQIENDRSRDKNLGSDGWRVIRFRGDIIHHIGRGAADRVHIEIDATQSGKAWRDFPKIFSPKSFEEAGEQAAADWYRATAPHSYQEDGA